MSTMISKALVVGSGAIGLRTALELLRNNVRVVLKSAHHPLDPKTCSQGAGGLWMPYKCSDIRVDQWARMTLDELLEMSKLDASGSKAESGSGSGTSRNIVEIVPTLFLTREHSGPTVNDFVVTDNGKREESCTALKSTTPLPDWTSDPRISFQHLSVEMLHFQNKLYKLRIPSLETLNNAGYSHGWFFRPPIVDPPRMLTSMMNEIEAHPLTEGVNVNMEGDGYASMENMLNDARELGCDTLINCTGLGGMKLCNDDMMIGGRGVLLHYDRNCPRSRKEDNEEGNINDAAILTEDAPWGTPTDPAYIIPRGDILVVGGAYHEGSTKTMLSESERKRLKENANLFGIDTGHGRGEPLDEWAGFRPCRQTVRLEIDEGLSSDSGLQVVHSYGHGGSGWTTYVGVAKDTVKMLLK